MRTWSPWFMPAWVSAQFPHRRNSENVSLSYFISRCVTLCWWHLQFTTALERWADSSCHVWKAPQPEGCPALVISDHSHTEGSFSACPWDLVFSVPWVTNKVEGLWISAYTHSIWLHFSALAHSWGHGGGLSQKLCICFVLPNSLPCFFFLVTRGSGARVAQG